MAAQKHLWILADGVTAWNRWREEQPVRPDLSLAMGAIRKPEWPPFSPAQAVSHFLPAEISRSTRSI
jgi:hypothetical protein